MDGSPRERMDREGRLSPEAVEALRASGVARAAVPVALGGPELDPMAQIELVEEFSRVDGAVGWCATIAAAMAWAREHHHPACRTHAQTLRRPGERSTPHEDASRSTSTSVRAPTGDCSTIGEWSMASTAARATFVAPNAASSVTVAGAAPSERDRSSLATRMTSSRVSGAREQAS